MAEGRIRGGTWQWRVSGASGAPIGDQADLRIWRGAVTNLLIYGVSGGVCLTTVLGLELSVIAAPLVEPLPLGGWPTVVRGR